MQECDIKLLIDARLPWGSGIGRYVANTVPRVADLMPDISFDLLVTPESLAAGQQLSITRANLTVSVFDVRPFSLHEQIAVPRRFAGYDLAWFTNYWVPLAFRQPFVAIVHDLLHLEPDLFPASAVKRRLSQATFRHVARRAAGIGFGSRFTQREFERRFGAKTDAVVTGYGIDHDGFSQPDLRTPPQKKTQLLVVAAAKSHKNFRIAIEAFNAAQVAPHWCLKIITPNDQLRSSIELGDLVAQQSRITFAQGLSDADLQAEYAETAIVLMPSLYEGFGLPLAEGLRAGAQCISSTAQSLVELGQGARISFVNGLDLPGWITAIEAECARFDAGQVSREESIANMHHAAGFKWDDVAERTVRLLTSAMR